jgi:hypothetical protein
MGNSGWPKETVIIVHGTWENPFCWRSFARASARVFPPFGSLVLSLQHSTLPGASFSSRSGRSSPHHGLRRLRRRYVPRFRTSSAPRQAVPIAR